MRVLMAGATGAIGRPLIGGLKQHGHSVFGLVRWPESARMLTEMDAERSSPSFEVSDRVFAGRELRFRRVRRVYRQFGSGIRQSCRCRRTLP